MQIIIASKNKGKIKEIKAFFKNLDIRWLTFEDFSSFPDIEETGSSFMENAKLKAKKIAEYTNKLTLADDSGLAVDYLKGSPGIKSSRYSGMDTTDKDNRAKLLKELKHVCDVKERKAKFICSMVLWDPKRGPIFETSNVCEGFIGKVEAGSGGFGYDSVFFPAGYRKTMAQLTQEEKNRISHRGSALKKLHKFVRSKIECKTGKK